MHRILEITDGEGKLDTNAGFIVQAAMIYPRSGKLRDQLMASYLAEALVRHPEKERLAPSLAHIIPTLYYSPTPAQVRGRAQRTMAGAWAPGRVLLQVLGAWLHHPELNATPTMALDILSQQIAAGELKFTGKPAGMSRRSLWGAWGDFKPAAHLWAAHFAVTHNREPDGPANAQIYRLETILQRALRSFLAFAEYLREMAIAARFLEDLDTWRTPPDLQFRETELPTLPPLPPDLITAFRDYVPEHAREDPLE